MVFGIGVIWFFFKRGDVGGDFFLKDKFSSFFLRLGVFFGAFGVIFLFRFSFIFFTVFLGVLVGVSLGAGVVGEVLARLFLFFTVFLVGRGCLEV